MARTTRLDEVFDFNTLTTAGLTDTKKTGNLILPSGVMKIGRDTTDNINVIVWSGGSSSGTFERFVEIDAVFSETATVTFSLLRGAVSTTRFNVKGSTEALAAPEAGDEIVLQYQKTGTSNWETSHEIALGDLSNSTYTSFTKHISITGHSFKVRLAQKLHHNASEDEYAMSSLSWVGHSDNSGIINLPPRILLRNLDRQDGAYPASLRGTNSDFMGSGLRPFDDLNTPTFTSNFSKAEIEFVAHENSSTNGVVFEDLTFIGLTGSVDESSGVREGIFNTFTFVNGASTPDIKVVTYDNDVRVHLSGSSDPRFIAHAFANQVNNQSMGIQASAIGSKVNLLMQIPNTGSNKQHKNIIVTGNLKNFQMDLDNPIKVSQFSEISSNNIKYPYLLPSSFSSLSNAVASPFTSASIETTGIARPGLDTVLHTPKFTDESLKPFDDSKLHIDHDSSFYAVGTPSSVFGGFSYPLKSKSSITFDLVSDASGEDLGTHIFYATASIADGTDTKHGGTIGKSGSGMAYWNRAENRWEMLTPESLDVHAHDADARAKACLGFSPSAGHIFTSPSSKSSNNGTFFLDLAGAVGNPVSEFGFPIAKQYNATGSQCYDMSDYISSPFLVEKIVLDIEGQFGLTGMATGDADQPYFKQFFVLNQPTHPDRPHISGSFALNHIKQITAADAAAGGSIESVNFETTGHRELVGYAKLGFIRDDHEAAPILGSNRLKVSGLKKDLADQLTLLPTADFNTHFGVSGSYVVEFEPSVASFSNGTSLLSIRQASDEHPSTHDYILLTNKGGASCNGDLSGRQIGSSFSNFPVVKILDKDEDGHTTLRREVRHQVRKHSPYLLMPKDRLIFGWQNHCVQPAATDEMTNITNNNNLRTDRAIATNLVDRIKRAKVTIFGSHISNEVEAHHGINQLLTTNTIYEAVGSDPVLDQFDVGELVMLSGSMSDAIMTGKAFAGTRRRICSVASGQSGTTGSLGRNIKQFRGDAFFKDSVSIDPFSSKKAKPFVTGNLDDFVDGAIVVGKPEVLADLGDSLDIDGTLIPKDVAINNFLIMFPGAMDGSFLQLADIVNMPLDVIEGGGVTDPPPDSNTAGQFVQFPINNSKDHEEEAGGYMMDALSTNGAQFGSQASMAGEADASKFISDFPTDLFNFHHSPGNSAYGHEGQEKYINPKLVEVTQNGTYKVISGSLFNKPGLLPDYGFNIESSNGVGIFQDATFRSLLATCFPKNWYDQGSIEINGGGVLAGADGFFVPAGFNYGYSHALPTPPSYFFSRRHYGFYSDMMETPGETALVVGTAGKQTPAVRVRFFSRGGEPHVDPVTTNSQNLSLFCTSSTPYDEGPGAKRDRSTTQPDLKDVVSISESMELDMES